MQRLQQTNRIAVVSSLAGLKAAEIEINWTATSLGTFVEILNKMERAKRVLIDGTDAGLESQAVKRLLGSYGGVNMSNEDEMRAAMKERLSLPDGVTVCNIGSALAV